MTARRPVRTAFARGTMVVVALLAMTAAACGSDTSADATTTSAPAVPSATTRPATTPPAATRPATTPPATTPGPGSDAGAAAPYCGSSRYVQEITVEEWADGAFRISVRPTAAARSAADPDVATAEIWQAIQACVIDLDDDVAASLTDQLRCHQFLALVPDPTGGERYATGETYDLESWRPAPGRARWLTTRCGNTLGTDPSTPSVRTYRPDGVPPQSSTSGERD